MDLANLRFGDVLKYGDDLLPNRKSTTNQNCFSLGPVGVDSPQLLVADHLVGQTLLLAEARHLLRSGSTAVQHHPDLSARRRPELRDPVVLGHSRRVPPRKDRFLRRRRRGRRLRRRLRRRHEGKLGEPRHRRHPFPSASTRSVLPPEVHQQVAQYKEA